jgi:hypothetical protein
MTNPLLDRLTRAQLAETLTSAGYPIALATLHTLATRGGGPPYELFGKKAMYVWGDALAWAKSKGCQPKTRTAA